LGSILFSVGAPSFITQVQKQRLKKDKRLVERHTMADNVAAQPIIQEPVGVVQFQYNSDYPSLEEQPPAEFPPADPSPCARITTRVYDASTNRVTIVQNVLVRTLLPTRMSTASSNMEEDSSSSSDSDDESMMEEDTTTPSQPQTEERAYWMQRTVREAIYGSVLYATVLKRRPRDANLDASLQADWEVTTQKCAIKEMSWQHIRKERDRLAEDPIKEVSAMQYLQRWYQANNNNNNNANDQDDNFFAPIMETNIMMPLDLLSDDRHLYSVMPYCNGGELFDRLDLNERFSEEEARYWMYQVLNVSRTCCCCCCLSRRDFVYLALYCKVTWCNCYLLVYSHLTHLPLPQYNTGPGEFTAVGHLPS